VNDFERSLQDTLSRHATDLGPSSAGRQAATVRSARRRRTLRGAFTAGLCIVVLSTSVPLARSLVNRSTSSDIADEPEAGPYDFTSQAGEGPVIATGDFRGISWSLEISDEDDPTPWLDLAFEDGSVTSMGAELDRYDIAETFPIPVEGEDAAVVFGLVTQDAAAANLETELGDEYRVAIFDGPVEPELHANYFISFYASEPADLVIRDTDGIELDREPLDDPKDSELTIEMDPLDCVAIAELDQTGSSPSNDDSDIEELAFDWEGDEGSSIAHGLYGKQEWALRTGEGDDGSPSLDLHLAPDSEDASMPDHLEPGDPIQWSSWMLEKEPAQYAYGIVTEDADSAALELDDGRLFDLPLFEGPDGSEVDYFILFYRDVGTRLLIRNEAGEVIAREELMACRGQDAEADEE
jgi:hypothetical protein